MLPSFTQTANADTGCGYDYDCVPSYGDRPDPRDPWDPWDDPDPYPPTCDYIGDPDCESEDQDDDGGDDPDPPECDDDNNSGLNKNGDECVAQCSAFREAQLRTMQSGIPNCNGDPGPNFNINNWLNENYWQLLTNNLDNWPDFVVGSITGWLSFFSDDLAALADVLDRNNGNVLDARRNFERDLWMTCHDMYATSEWQTHQNLYITNDDARECYISANFLMESYMPGDSLLNTGIDFVFPTNFSTTWGEMFSDSVDNHFACHAVYQAWDEENCGGNL